MTRAENTLRAARFERPEHIPVSFGISAPCWNRYPQDALKALMAEHPLLFPGYQPVPGPVKPRYARWRRAGAPYTDSWGCVWETNEDGVTGAVVKHSVERWGDLAQLVPPSPDEHDGWGPVDWTSTGQRLAQARDHGGLAQGSLRHGHTFLTLSYIRGYENLLYDMADAEPRLWRLIETVESFNQGLVDRYLKLGARWMGFPEDLGMQVGPMLSPQQFRTYIRPSYERLIGSARRAGCVIHMHSDGDIRALAPDLIDIGVDVLNLQDLVNGIDWIREHLRGRVCVDLDVDRQQVTRFGTPEQVEALVREAVLQLGSREGGLMLTHGLYPGVPLVNVKALMDAMERYATHYG